MSDELEEQVPFDGQPEEQPDDELFLCAGVLVKGIVLIMLIVTFVMRPTQVIGSSMDPTLSNGEMLLVWSLGYKPQAGDVVILYKNTEEYASRLDVIVKRVIATGGQTVEIDYDSGTVYVDGQALDEPYIKERMEWPRMMEMWETHYEVPEGSVFVMGDNRNNSNDSRNPLVGMVDTRYVLGRARAILFPFNKIGSL